MEARLSAPLSERMLDLAGIGPGKRVLDLATGRGEPAVRAARRVAPTGHVLGVDPAASMLMMARERATREGVTNLELRAVEATRLEGVPTCYFEATLIRWGLMFMDSPLAALETARHAMVPHGPLVVAVWAEPERAPFLRCRGACSRSIEHYRRWIPTLQECFVTQIPIDCAETWNKRGSASGTRRKWTCR